jgi:hypothetical protein
MKVATLRLEMTRQFHLRTSNSSGASSIFRLPLTFTWQARRTPRRASAGLMKPVSVGSSAPPPSSTVTLHTPHEPLPPQAEGMKTLLAASAPSSVLPIGAFSALPGSSLISSSASPSGTSRVFANISSTTSSSTTPLKITVAVVISSMAPRSYSLMPENIMKPIDISPVVTKAMPRPRRPAGTSL